MKRSLALSTRGQLVQNKSFSFRKKSSLTNCIFKHRKTLLTDSHLTMAVARALVFTSLIGLCWLHKYIINKNETGSTFFAHQRWKENLKPDIKLLQNTINAVHYIQTLVSKTISDNLPCLVMLHSPSVDIGTIMTIQTGMNTSKALTARRSF